MTLLGEDGVREAIEDKRTCRTTARPRGRRRPGHHDAREDHRRGHTGPRHPRGWQERDADDHQAGADHRRCHQRRRRRFGLQRRSLRRPGVPTARHDRAPDPEPGHGNAGWQFWIDRGGTFTDVVALRPDGRLVTHKLLSEDPARYQDAAVAGIRAILGIREARRCRPRLSNPSGWAPLSPPTPARTTWRADRAGRDTRLWGRAAHRLPEPAPHIRPPHRATGPAARGPSRSTSGSAPTAPCSVRPISAG